VRVLGGQSLTDEPVGDDRDAGEQPARDGLQPGHGRFGARIHDNSSALALVALTV
jgi:hypothetical protein